jgi:hypothetical protein
LLLIERCRTLPAAQVDPIATGIDRVDVGAIDEFGAEFTRAIR